MDRDIDYIISGENEGISSESFLRKMNYSSKLITGIKKAADGICINGKPEFANKLLKKGDILHVKIRENDSSFFEYLNYPLDVVYEDEDLIVINKPANMPIHPSMNNYNNTLGNAVSYYFAGKKNFVFRCINRLDKDTSGLTIIAKNPLSAALLSNMQLCRKIKRTYIAIVSGNISEAGTVNAPIARANESIIERVVDFVRGEEAITHYKPLVSEDRYSLIALSLETGRTHQIRVHMKYIGHPLIGDTLYNPGSDKIIKRQALHSYRLVFYHPITNELIDLRCPYPKDMNDIFKFPGKS